MRLAEIARTLLVCRRAMAAGLLAVALCLAPLAASAGAHSAHGHSHSAADHHHGPAEDRHADHDHDAFHCGSHVCAPSFLIGCPTEHALHAPAGQRGASGDASVPRALCLDGDPPIPRDGASRL